MAFISKNRRNAFRDVAGVISPLHAGDDVYDTDLQQHALAALQKLSLRRSAQEALVQYQMVPWTIEFLRRHETLSEYAVEYALATLMNMCLCRDGRCAFGCTVLHTQP